MLFRSPSNVVFILSKGKQGMDVQTIYDRIQERIAWHGPYPNSTDIVRLLLEYSIDVRHRGDVDDEAQDAGRTSRARRNESVVRS